jgi:uncharacterized protein
MANPSAVHEPSMEEILASIRQIISEDGDSAAPKIDGVVAGTGNVVRHEPMEPEARRATVEHLTAPRATAEPIAVKRPTFEPRKAEVGLTIPADQQKPAAEAKKDEPSVEAKQDKPSGDTKRPTRPEPAYGDTMRRPALGDAPSTASNRPPQPVRPSIAPRVPAAKDDKGPLLSPASGDAISGAFGALAHTILAQNSRTLEDVVTEMLQPMLKQWLDDNLPSIVERKVQEEIERVSRGRR